MKIFYEGAEVRGDISIKVLCEIAEDKEIYIEDGNLYINERSRHETE